MVKFDINKDCVTIFLNEEKMPVNNSLPFVSLSNMIVPCEKAEALLPILLVSCLCLNSISDVVHQRKYILQPIFAAAYFSTIPNYFHFPFNMEELNAATLVPKQWPIFMESA
jgi:hypothetical protein